MQRHILLNKIEQHIESPDVLGLDIGTGEEVIDFLARLEMEVVEQLLGTSFTDRERELVLNWVEERKGRLADHELPTSEARSRAVHRKLTKRRKR